MKIGLRGGHSCNCIGAVGLRDEYSQMQQLYKYVRDILISNGHTIIDCNSNAHTDKEELSEGIQKANNNNVDLFISFHMNASDGNGHGTEAWIYPGSSSRGVAQRLVNNFATLGFQNRGVKETTGLYEVKHASAPAIIFETCFCDNERDIGIWSPTDWNTLAMLICNAIDTNITTEPLKNDGNVYIVTNYLPTGYMGKSNTSFKGIDMKYVDSFMCGVRWEVIPNSYGQWAETELLDRDKAEEVRNSLGSWFCEFRK